MSWVELRRAIANDNSNTANWSDDSSSVEVTQRKGFMCNVKARGKLQMEPDRVFDILVAPDNHRYFSGIKRIDYRKVLEDDKAGKMKVEVQQVGQWKFLGFSGEFSTTLYVHQDKKAGKIGFQLAKPGWMKDFAGTWTIQPLTQKDLLHTPSAVDHSSQSKQQGVGVPGFLDMLPFQKTKGSFVTLEQSILPGFVPPKPLDRVLKGISAKQVQNVLEDLRQEVERQSAEGNNGKIPAVMAATRLQEDADSQTPVRKKEPPSAFG